MPPKPQSHKICFAFKCQYWQKDPCWHTMVIDRANTEATEIVMQAQYSHNQDYSAEARTATRHAFQRAKVVCHQAPSVTKHALNSNGVPYLKKYLSSHSVPRHRPDHTKYAVPVHPRPVMVPARHINQSLATTHPWSTKSTHPH